MTVMGHKKVEMGTPSQYLTITMIMRPSTQVAISTYVSKLLCRLRGASFKEPPSHVPRIHNASGSMTRYHRIPLPSP